MALNVWLAPSLKQEHANAHWHVGICHYRFRYYFVVNVPLSGTR